MGSSLVVVESPAKAKTINKFLGKDFKVLACMGHVRDLPQKELGIDIEKEFEPKYQTIRGKGKVLNQLRSAAKSADNIYLATDPDREGEAIAWHVAHALGKKPDEVFRILFNEITERAVIEAVSTPGRIDLDKVDAQQARRILDRLLGYKLSPFLWKIIYRGLSAGRVQSVALRMICEREAEIDAFDPVEYWTIDTRLETANADGVTARVFGKNGEKIEIPNEAEAADIVTAIRAAQESPDGIEIKKVTKREQRRNPSPPFITSTLQQDASRRLRFTARKTMAIAQQLYEGVEIGNETSGLITYMRTDSTRLSDDAVTEARTYIETRFGKDYLPKTPKIYKRGKAAQDAHEAIRPTTPDATPESLSAHLSPDQAKLYKLIWDRFIACQMMPAVYDRTAVDIRAGEIDLRATGSILKFPGFTALYMEGKDDDQEDEEDRQLPESLAEGDQLKLADVTPEQHFTKPPARYSEATLVKELEAKEIGRPSTYQSIISVLQDRKYVEKDRGRFIPTKLGKTVNGVLVQALPDILNVEFTARMEGELDKVETGDYKWVDVVRDFYTPFSKDLSQLEKNRESIKAGLQEATGEDCGKCGKPMFIKWGRNGQFQACSGFPDCRNTKPLEEDEASMETDEVCDKCGAPMIMRTGRHGRFLACSKYEDTGCKNTKPIPVGVPCPKCGGNIVERRSKRGRLFFGCGSYPECDFSTWDKPLNKTCPSCDGPFLAESTGRGRDPQIKCMKCRQAVSAEALEENPDERADPVAAG
jgi:DNA topoisomerase-1